MSNSKLNTLINPFTLTFKDKELEGKFTDYSITRVREILKKSVLIAVISSILVGVIAYYGSYKISFFSDVILQTCFAIIFIIISNSNSFLKFYSFYFVFVFVIMVLYMLFRHYHEQSLFPIINVFAIVLFLSLVPYIKFSLQVLASISVILVLFLFPFFDSTITFFSVFEKSLILLSYFMLVSMSLYIKQKYERLSFYNSLELDKLNSKLLSENKTLEMQSKLGEILQNSTQSNLVLKDFLNQSLDIILDISWLKIMPKGSIFVTNKNGDLEMIADKNLGELTQTCAIVKSGQCLCGKALQDKKMLFNNCVTTDHTIRPEGMTPHGHFNVPLMFEERVLGVLNVYVEHGHKKTDDEENFFSLVADTIASVIFRSQLLKEKDVQSKIIESNHQKITSSIEYAYRIQKSLLKYSDKLNELFKDVVIKYLPKEIVSGDFYFVKKIKHKTYIAVADCTGHGVPGSMVATIGILELYHLTDLNLQVDEILNRLNETISFLLNNDNQIGSDGMDLVMLCIDEEKQTIEYSGAKGIFYIYQNEELIRYKTDPYSIGEKISKNVKFTSQTLSYSKNDVVFLLTDGILDQISGVDNKRIGSKRVKQLMLEMCQNKTKNNSELFDEFYNKHQSAQQIDDITFINFKL